MNLTKLPPVSMVDAWIASGEYGQAKMALQCVEAEKPKSSELHRCWADLYLAQDCVALAEEYAIKAYSYNRQSPSAVAALAECYSRQGQNARALGLVHPIAAKQFNLRIMKLYCKLAAKGFGRDRYVDLHERYCRCGQISSEHVSALSLTFATRKIDDGAIRTGSRALDPRRLVCRDARA